MSAASCLWVDFLCHLDVPERVQRTLGMMGELYMGHTTLPLYLADEAKRGTVRLEPSEVEEAQGPKVEGVQEALRRRSV